VIGDMELAAYLANAAGPPVPLVLDLRIATIAHERWESSSSPSLNGH
jgi:hypothetical protein